MPVVTLITDVALLMFVVVVVVKPTLLVVVGFSLHLRKELVSLYLLHLYDLFVAEEFQDISLQAAVCRVLPKGNE